MPSLGSQPVIRFGTFELDAASGELRKAGIPLKLQPQPFRVLYLLAQRAGQVVARDEIRHALWDGEIYVDFDRSINFCINQIRAALDDNAEKPRFIETLPRKGYRFIALIPDSSPKAEAVRKNIWPPRLAWAGLAAAVLLAGAVAIFRFDLLPSLPRPVKRFTIPISPDQNIILSAGTLAISPDGASLVYVAWSDQAGARFIFVRHLHSDSATLIPETENAFAPFFSPDGHSIAFMAPGKKLEKVSVAGGAPVVLCETPGAFAGSWGPNDMLFFPDPSESKIFRVPAAGGTREAVAAIPAIPGERGLRQVEVLPGGQAILYMTGGTPGALSGDAIIGVVSLKTGEQKILVHGGASPHYVQTGHLLYVKSGKLMAVPFNLRELRLSGTATPVLDDVWQGEAGFPGYSVSAEGSLAYVTGGELGPESLRFLNEVDFGGEARLLMGTPHATSALNVSPDGRRVALDVRDLPPGDVWIFDLTQNTFSRFTSSKPGEQALYPLWSADGAKLIYTAGHTGSELHQKSVRGGGAEELLYSEPSFAQVRPQSVSPDGNHLIFERTGPWDIWVLNLKGDRKAHPIVVGHGFDVAEAQLSPDGRWLAYTTNESHRFEIYVQPFPSLQGRWQISTDGGVAPRWSRDGRHLYYRKGNANDVKMMVAEIRTKPIFSAAPPQILFNKGFAHTGGVPSYDLASDGRHFLMLKVAQNVRPRMQLHMVLNWTEELKRLAPSK